MRKGIFISEDRMHQISERLRNKSKDGMIKESDVLIILAEEFKEAGADMIKIFST